MNENTPIRAEIISVGTEMMLGNITDTNATYLAQELAALGVNLYWVSQVGDNMGRLVEVLRRAWDRSDLIIMTGGLGPTEDDLTREGIAELMGEEMVVQPELETELRAFFSGRGMQMPESNVKQATLIKSAQVLHNPVGTAPGWWVEREVDGKPRVIVTMPGVPHEMKRMWSREALPKLAGLSGAAIESRTIKLLGIGESAAEELIRDLLHSNNPSIGTYAKNDGIHLRLTARADTREAAQALLVPLEAAVRERVGDTVWGINEDTLEDVICALLQRFGQRLSIVEAGGATGGAIARLLTSSPLSADSVAAVLVMPSVAYDANASGLGSLLDGEVSRERAQALALAARNLWQVEVGLATIGLLPTGRDDERVGGEMMAALAIGPAGGEPTSLTSVRLPIRSARGEVKRLMALAALNLLRKELLEHSDR